MKHKHLNILLLFLASFLFLLTSCTNYVVIDHIEMVNKETIEFEAGDYSFDGIKINVFYADGETKELDLTDDMVPEVERLNFYKIGEHDVNVVYMNRYQTTMKIKVVRHDFDDIYSLNSYTCTYDGKPHKVELNYELPEGAKIEYLYGNTFTNAGVYDVIGVISKNGYNSKTLRATLTIEKAEYDLSTVSFEDQEVTYDGEPKLIVAENVPDNIEVTYDIYNEEKTVRMNNAINVGTYLVVAKFNSNDENYENIPNKEALLTISKASYDMSHVYLNDYTKEYDGEAYEAKLTNDSVLPTGVIASFKYYNENNEEVLLPTNAGKYKVVASFTGNKTNYQDIENIEATLTINKRIVYIKNNLTFDSKTINFNRNVHSLEVVGNIPDTVELTYENNDHIYAGEYKVIAHFSSLNPNETVDVQEMEAFLIINRIRESVKVLNDETTEYEDITSTKILITTDAVTGEKTLSIKGLETNRYSIYKYKFTNKETNENVELSALQNGKVYVYEIIFIFINEGENDSVILAPVSGELTYTNA